MSDISRLVRKLESLPERLEEAGEESIQDELETVESRAKRNLSQNDTNWTGELSNSAVIVPIPNGYSLRWTAGQGPYVEYGTGFYFGTDAYPIPPDVSPYPAPGGVTEDMVDNIERWVRTKPIVGEHYSTDRDLAEAISHTIAELGTQAQPFIRPAWYGYREQFIQNVRRDIKREARTL